MGSGRMLDHGGRGRDGVRFWRECTPCHQTKAVPGAHRTASSVLLIKWLAPFGTDLCSAERETIPFTADHADGHRCQPSFQRFPCLPAFPASSLPSVKRIGFLAAVFPSASSACSCKADPPTVCVSQELAEAADNGNQAPVLWLLCLLWLPKEWPQNAQNAQKGGRFRAFGLLASLHLLQELAEAAETEGRHPHRRERRERRGDRKIAILSELRFLRYLL